MPVSKKQLRANRQNARKSTGPKSYEGKQMASRNGVKYGLYSQDIIITSQNLKENKEEYDRLLDSLLDEFQPQTGMQLYLVHKIANSLWRSRRAIRAETAEITGQLDDIDIDSSVRKEFLKIAHQIDGSKYQEISRNEELRQASIEIGRQSIPDEESSINILRYEMRLDRQLTRAYKLLCQLQDRQSRNQTDADSREEIFVPVFKCPAEHGMECPRDPQSVEGEPRTPEGVRHPPRQGAGHPGSQSADRMSYPSYKPVTTAEEGFNRPTVDIVGQEPCAPDYSMRPTPPVADNGESRSTEPEPSGSQGAKRMAHPPRRAMGSGVQQNHQSRFRQVLPAEGPPRADDLPDKSPATPRQNHHQTDTSDP